MYENSPIDGSTVVGLVQADDNDGGELTYKILSGNETNKFSIDSKTGVITVNDDLNYEDRNQYNLVIEVSDNGALSETATISIAVNNINEAPVAVSDTEETYENSVLAIDVLANDRDVDFNDTPDNFILTSASIVDDAGNEVSGKGAVSITENQLSFSPNTDFDHLAIDESETITITYFSWSVLTQEVNTLMSV